MNQCTVSYTDENLLLEQGETFLDAAERHGIRIPNSCRSGACQTCLIKVVSGSIPARAQQSLTPQQKRQSMALACQLQPTEDMVLAPLGRQTQVVGEVVEHRLLTDNILSLQLKSTIAWEAGQFISLWKDDQTARSYSIASLPESDVIECHIQKHRQGEVSRWLHDEVSVGDTIMLSGPRGNCFYDPSMHQKKILLIGSGTGMAPLYGILKDALKQGHKESIVLYHGTNLGRKAYLMSQFEALAQQRRQFSAQEFTVESDNPVLHIAKMLQDTYPCLQNWCVFLCGSPKLVQKLQKQCFLNGAALNDIHTDPFITRSYS